MLFKICSLMFGVSTIVRVSKDHGANVYIERKKNKRIIADPRSFSEKTFDFIKDYFYLLIPVVNLYKSFKIFITPGKEYASQRENLLDDRERLVDKVVEEKKQPIEKPIEEAIKKQKEEKKQEKKLPEIKPNKTLTLEDELKEYLLEDRKYRGELKILQDRHASVSEENVVRKKIIDVNKKIDNVEKRIQIRNQIAILEEQQKELNSLKNSMILKK